MTLCCIPLFIKLGLWQYNKAQQKIALQATYDSYRLSKPVDLPTKIDEVEEYRYKPVHAVGHYIKKYEILLDNQVEGEAAGYHVITPLLMDQSNTLVLVDRGWIPASESHLNLPKVETPDNRIDVDGRGWIPSTKFFNLGSDPSDGAKLGEWETVWENMDMKRYQDKVPYKVLPVVIRLDPNSTNSGFVRNWVAPSDRTEMHLGYAYQWFGFACSALAIYIYVSFKKMKS